MRVFYKTLIIVEKEVQITTQYLTLEKITTQKTTNLILENQFR